MDALTRQQRAAHVGGLAIELGKYADEHDAQNDDRLALKAVAASEGVREYAEALNSDE
jgi:hypothetical protein